MQIFIEEYPNGSVEMMINEDEPYFFNSLEDCANELLDLCDDARDKED